MGSFLDENSYEMSLLQDWFHDRIILFGGGLLKVFPGFNNKLEHAFDYV
jgi:hypothetical protein